MRHSGSLGRKDSLDIIAGQLGPPVDREACRSRICSRRRSGSTRLRAAPAPMVSASFRSTAKVLLERYVRGRELAVSISWDGRQPRALPIVEAIPSRWATPSTTSNRGIRPDRPEFVRSRRAGSPRVASEVERLALETFTAMLGCRGFGRWDLMLDGSGQTLGARNSTPYPASPRPPPWPYGCPGRRG